MGWSSWVWGLPATLLIIGLTAPWIVVLAGLARPDPIAIAIAITVDLAIVSLTWRYLKAVGFWFICMTRRNRSCLNEAGDQIWFLDPTVLTFARSDIVGIERGLQSRSTDVLAISLRGRLRPVKINVRHFEGGSGAVMAFLAPEMSSAPSSGQGPWG